MSLSSLRRYSILRAILGGLIILDLLKKLDFLISQVESPLQALGKVVIEGVDHSFTLTIDVKAIFRGSYYVVGLRNCALVVINGLRSLILHQRGVLVTAGLESIGAAHHFIFRGSQLATFLTLSGLGGARLSD